MATAWALTWFSYVVSFYWADVHKAGLLVATLSRPKAKDLIQNIWQAESGEDAKSAFNLLIKTYKINNRISDAVPKRR